MVYEEPAILRMWPQLSDCIEGFAADKETVYLAVQQLSNCREHHGRHHFAVVQEGTAIVYSKTASECLATVNIHTPIRECN